MRQGTGDRLCPLPLTLSHQHLCRSSDLQLPHYKRDRRYSIMGKKSPASKTSMPKASPHRRKVRPDDRRAAMSSPHQNQQDDRAKNAQYDGDAVAKHMAHCADRDDIRECPGFEPRSGECEICHKTAPVAPIYTVDSGNPPEVANTCCEGCCKTEHGGQSYAIVNGDFGCDCEDGKCACEVDDVPGVPDYWFSTYDPFAIDRDDIRECPTCCEPVIRNGRWGNFDYCFECGRTALADLQDTWRSEHKTK